MNIKNWKEEYEGVAEYTNDGNDFYYEWVSVDLKGDGVPGGLVELFEKFLGVDVSTSPVKIKVKCGDGLLFLQRVK